MRGVETRIQEIRHAIFTEVAKMAYDTEIPAANTVEEIPYHIIPGETGSFRSDRRRTGAPGHGTSMQRCNRACTDIG